MPSDIIARLRTATEGSRELDEGIARHLGYTPSWNDGGEIWFYPPGKRSGSSHIAPEWTISTDAAWSLKPASANCWYLEHTPQGIEATISRNYVKDSHWSATGEGNTDALAICVAALRAREIGK